MIKKSLKAKIKKEREKRVKEINSVVIQAVKNFDFLSTLLVEGDSEATYHKIMDFREAVESMIDEMNGEQNKKGEA